ncbi:MAG: DUF11 domain-containing protein [Oscillospiraceae bacterium]|nr:DUF11 domain-containing protein [Oscillospiraceae bacterium]
MQEAIKPIIDHETFVDVIRETAMAYYNKGPLVQYDGKPLTIREARKYSGCKRPCGGEAPEEGASDRWLYSVCSDFVYTVYKAAFGYDLMGTPQEAITKVMTALPSSDPRVVFKYDPSGNDPGAETELEKALWLARQTLSAGDVIVSYGTKSGHAMLCVGDIRGDGHNYIMHCWGKSFNEETGEDPLEVEIKHANPRGGAIRIDDVDEALFAPPEISSGCWNLWDEKRSGVGIVILRPYGTEEFAALPLPETGRLRLKYRGIEICKESGVTRYGAVQTGDLLRLTVTVTNHSDTRYEDLVVTEPLPSGAKLHDAGLGTLTKDGVVWKLILRPGRSVALSYTVCVTASRGEAVTFPRGSVGGIPTRTFSVPVGGKKLPPENAELLREGKLTLPPVSEPIGFVNDLYRQLFGASPELPTDFDALTAALFDSVEVLGADAQYGGRMWKPKASVEPKWQRLRDMVPPEHLAGRAVFLEGDPQAVRKTWSTVDRVQEYRAERYEIGDIFLALRLPDMLLATDVKNVQSFVYLGEGTVACCDGAQGVKIAPFDETVGRLIIASVVICLRPTMAYDDFTAGK